MFRKESLAYKQNFKRFVSVISHIGLGAKVLMVKVHKKCVRNLILQKFTKFVFVNRSP